MCLIALAFDAHPDYALIVAANRDEFYRRPTTPADFWPEPPDVLAGRDERAGGTWMGLRRDGAWAAVTNYREPGAHRDDARSRGDLVANYLRGSSSPENYAQRVAAQGDDYNGFNLLLGTPEALWYVTNRGGAEEETPRRIAPGVHGLSTHLPDTPWPKVARSARRLQRLIDADAVAPEALLDLLGDRTQAAPDELPDTGVEADLEAALSAPLIVTPAYGTRSSTVLLIDREGAAAFVERTFAPGGEEGAVRRFSF